MKAFYLAVWAALAMAVTPYGAHAQQATRQAPQTPQATPAPRRATVVVPAGDSNFDVTLSVHGAEAASYLAVKATNADIRELFREMGQRSGAAVLIAPSAAGRVTVDMESQPVEQAMRAVAKRAGLSVASHRCVRRPGCRAYARGRRPARRGDDRHAARRP